MIKAATPVTYVRQAFISKANPNFLLSSQWYKTSTAKRYGYVHWNSGTNEISSLRFIWIGKRNNSAMDNTNFLHHLHIHKLDMKIWNCIQKVVLSNFSSSVERFLSHLSMTIKCLSKLHGSLWITLSASSLLSNTNNPLWFPILCTSNLFLACQNGVKVLAIASMFLSPFLLETLWRKNSWELTSSSR